VMPSPNEPGVYAPWGLTQWMPNMPILFARKPGNSDGSIFRGRPLAGPRRA